MFKTHPQGHTHNVILGTIYNYYRETDGSKVGAVKREPDLVKRDPNLVKREPDTVSEF